jgi:hypothetical protein
VYQLVSPAVALVSAPSGLTAGLLVDENHLLTSARVVWFDSSATVVFPNGIEISDAAVVGLDTLAGVALLDLGEVDGLPVPATVVSDSDLSLGSEVLFIGYGFSDQGDANPALVEGVITQIRLWEAGQVAFIRTNAPVDFDFRGVVATTTGSVLAASISGIAGPDWLPLVDSLLKRARSAESNPSAESWSTVLANAGEGATEIETTLSDEADERTWLLDVAFGESGSINAESAGDIAIEVIGPDGLTLVSADESLDGLETAPFDIEVPGPHFVRLKRFGEGPIDVRVESSHALVELGPGEASVPVDLGTSLEGAIDYVGDTDVYIVDLESGTDVVVSVQSVTIDPYVCVSRIATPETSISCDDDSGGGFFGLDSELRFSSDEPGTYLIRVRPFGGSTPGGYLLAIEAD